MKVKNNNNRCSILRRSPVRLNFTQRQELLGDLLIGLVLQHQLAYMDAAAR